MQDNINSLLMRLILACEDANAEILKFDITDNTPIALIRINAIGSDPIMLTYDENKDEWL